MVIFAKVLFRIFVKECYKEMLQLSIIPNCLSLESFSKYWQFSNGSGPSVCSCKGLANCFVFLLKRELVIDLEILMHTDNIFPSIEAISFSTLYIIYAEH